MRRHRSVAEERRAAETHGRAGGAVFEILNLRLPSGKRPIRNLNELILSSVELAYLLVIQHVAHKFGEARFNLSC